VAVRPNVRQSACARKFSSWDEPKSANEDFVIQIVSRDGMFLSVELLILYGLYMNFAFNCCCPLNCIENPHFFNFSLDSLPLKKYRINRDLTRRRIIMELECLQSVLKLTAEVVKWQSKTVIFFKSFSKLLAPDSQFYASSSINLAKQLILVT
jgi:hypothetical protein